MGIFFTFVFGMILGGLSGYLGGFVDTVIQRLVDLLPSFASYIIVSLTLAIPQTILGETALSFLGLGLQPPVVSWGVLLQDAQNVQAIAHHCWLLIPACSSLSPC